MDFDPEVEDVDSIMAELGLTPDDSAPAGSPPEGIVMDDPPVDKTPNFQNSSSGPGAAYVSAGPGAAYVAPPPTRFSSAGPGAMSSGPGLVSSGPGAMNKSIPGAMSYGPAQRMSSGPGVPVSTGLSIHSVKDTTPDGRAVSFNGPPCATCGEMILGRVTNALGKTYHPEHFFCAHCHKEFTEGDYIEHDGEPYCENDYNQMFGPKCHNCGRGIIDKCITALGKKYHPEHFTCTGCGTELRGKGYKEDEGDPYCLTCKQLKKKRIEPNAQLCGKCKRPITGEYVIVKGLRMHPEHFRCEECGVEFSAGNCLDFEGKLYCRADYLRLLRKTCALCHKPIVGLGTTALGRMWHPEHWLCFTCKEPFNGSDFYEHGGNPYCEQHYQELFGDTCAYCNKGIVGKVLAFEGKSYHPEHFLCNGCDKNLVDAKGMTQWEGKPLCTNCFKHLPKEVKAQILKKRKLEQKAKSKAKK